MNLNDIKEAVEAKYIAFPITFTEEDGGPEHTLKLRNMMRLSQDEQEEIQELSQSFDPEAGVSTARPMFKQYLMILADDKSLVNKFLAVIGDDLAIMSYVMEQYGEVTQAEKA